MSSPRSAPFPLKKDSGLRKVVRMVYNDYSLGTSVSWTHPSHHVRNTPSSSHHITSHGPPRCTSNRQCTARTRLLYTVPVFTPQTTKTSYSWVGILAKAWPTPLSSRHAGYFFVVSFCEGNDIRWHME